MRFVKIHNFILMKTGKTQNSFGLTEEQIDIAVVNKEFNNAPIIFNENETFNDYRNDIEIEKLYREKVVGVILPNTIQYDGILVTGDVMLIDDFSERMHFDNWCIQLNDDKTSFEYCSCELFSKSEE